MRILFLTQWFDPEPGAIRGLPLARELTQSGDAVEVLTGFPNYPGGRLYPGYKMRPWRREALDGVPIVRVPLYPSHDSSSIGRFFNYSSFALSAAALAPWLTARADVAYVYHPPPTVGLPAMALKALRGTPSVYHIADMWPESVIESGMVGSGALRRIAGNLIGAWCKLVYAQSDAITVLSPGFKRLLTERGVPAEKVHVVYNWTDEQVFQPAPRRNRLAADLGLENTFNVVYAGNIGAFQGIDTLVRAAPLLTDVPDVRLVIAGTGHKEGEVKALAAELGTRNVVFLGRREYWEMPDVYGLSDVLVVHLKDLDFFSATIPSKTQVSLACGRPVLMAVRGDSAEIVRNANGGLTCDPEQPWALAAAIRQFVNMSPQRRAELGGNGRDYYLRHMSLAEGARRMREIFAAVSNGTTRLERAHA